MGCIESTPEIIPNFYDSTSNIKIIKLKINDYNVKNNLNSQIFSMSNNNNPLTTSQAKLQLKSRISVNVRHKQSLGSVGISYCSEECDNPEVYDWLSAPDSPQNSLSEKTMREQEAINNAKLNTYLDTHSLRVVLSTDKPTEQTYKLKFQVDKAGNRHINQYKLIKKLGQGAHGRVELCEDPKNNRYAVKILNKSINHINNVSHTVY